MRRILTHVHRNIKNVWHWRPKNPKVFWISLGVTLILISPFIASLGYDLYYQGKVIPGVYLAELNLSGKNVVQTQLIIAQVYKEASPSIALKFGNKNFVVNGSDFDYRYQTDATVERAMSVGRSGAPWQMIAEQYSSLNNPIKIIPAYTYSISKLDKILADISKVVAKPAHDASFSLVNGSLTIIPEETGWAVPVETVKVNLLTNLATFNYSPLTLPIKAENPQITKEDLASQKEFLDKKLANLPKLTFEDQSWDLTPKEALKFWQLEKVGSALSLVYDQKELEVYLQTLANKINSTARGEVFKTDAAGRVIEFRPSQTGYDLQVSASAKAIGEALVYKDDVKQVALVVKQETPPKDSNSYGIKELLGTGSSNFAGSIPGRIHNINLSSSKFDGVLIGPGEEVSFVKLVGEVDAAHGYDEAYIISEGRTILGTGGGLCQVSTTLFRAALYSGLPIITRTAHAYRVHYYEPPVGMDATVFTPSLDLIFKNDTPAYILIQREIDIPNNNLAFKIYGTSDGRITNITTPVVTNEIAPPAPLYQEDPTLRKGVTNQVDWSAWGATATFKRQVRRGNETLIDETFTSVFQPWRAIYMVGTKE